MGILVRLLAAALVLGSAACAGEAAEPTPQRAHASTPVGWSTLPAPPFYRFRGTAVWTGTELVYWGGESEYGDEVHGDGAAFNPATGGWRPLASGPLSARSGAAAVWTGDEVLIWAGVTRRRRTTERPTILKKTSGEPWRTRRSTPACRSGPCGRARR